MKLHLQQHMVNSLINAWLTKKIKFQKSKKDSQLKLLWKSLNLIMNRENKNRILESKLRL